MKPRRRARSKGSDISNKKQEMVWSPCHRDAAGAADKFADNKRIDGLLSFANCWPKRRCGNAKPRRTDVRCRREPSVPQLVKANQRESSQRTCSDMVVDASVVLKIREIGSATPIPWRVGSSMDRSRKDRSKKRAKPQYVGFARRSSE